MTKHLYGSIVTARGIAANNRGENEGNMTTLQKLLWRGDVHTTISSEALRFAIRYLWQKKHGEEQLNRRWKEEGDKPSHTWQDANFGSWENFLDDDVLGFMSAQAAKEEANEEKEEANEEEKKKNNKEEKATGKKPKARGTTQVRRSRLEIARAISLSPFRGEVIFNAASTGATPSASSTGKDPVPYGTEVHATRYQYGFALTPSSLAKSERSLDVVEALVQLSDVAGNHARFLYDFSPDTVIFRWTDDFAPRLLYAFEASEDESTLSVPTLLQRIQSQDLNPAELIVGGSLASMPDGEALKKAGVQIHLGVKAAAEEVKKRIKEDLGI